MSGPNPPISPPINALIAQQGDALARLAVAEVAIAAAATSVDLTGVESDLAALASSLGTLATQDGTFSGASSGNNTGDQTDISGNAAGSDADAVAADALVASGAASALASHEADTTAIHGIANTADLVVTSDARLSDARTPTAHNQDASTITTGTIAQARLGTGSAGAGEKFLADDQTYKTPTSSAAGEWIRQAAARTLTNTTAVQKLFDSVANGTLTLATGVYSFKAMFGVTGMSGTSGNAQFALLGAGTATLAAILFGGVGIDSGGIANVTTVTGSASITASSAASALTAGTGTTMWFQVEGEFDCTVAGTLIPSIALVTAIAATVAAGSYFSCLRKGATGAVSFGNWS